jgi:hypothetical protein
MKKLKYTIRDNSNLKIKSGNQGPSVFILKHQVCESS